MQAHLKRIWFISPRFDFCIRLCCKIVCSASINIMTPSQCMIRRLVHFFPASNGNMHAKQTGLFHLRFPFCVRLCFHIIFSASIEIMRPFKCIQTNSLFFSAYIAHAHFMLLCCAAALLLLLLLCCCRSAAAALLLPLCCCRSAAAALLLPLCCSAALLLPLCYCRSIVAALLLLLRCCCSSAAVASVAQLS